MILVTAGFTVPQIPDASRQADAGVPWIRTNAGLEAAQPVPVERTAAVQTFTAGIGRAGAWADDAPADRIGPQPSYGFTGVGFPHIETVRETLRYQPFEKMISFGEVDTAAASLWQSAGKPIPYVRCMGISPQQLAQRVAVWEADIITYSMRHGVSASLVKAVITEESCFDPQARSPAGARGLMQLMPATAAWLGVEHIDDPQQNLDGGIRYLARLQSRFDDPELVLAAYNAGPGAVRRHGGIPPFPETRRYVERVRANHRRYVTATRLANQIARRLARGPSGPLMGQLTGQLTGKLPGRAADRYSSAMTEGSSAGAAAQPVDRLAGQPAEGATITATDLLALGE